MKEKIIYVLSLFLLTVSCQKESKSDYTDFGVEMLVSSEGMTSLDNLASVAIKNPLKNLSSVAIVHKGISDPNNEAGTTPQVDMGTISLSDGVGSGTLTEAQLGISETGWKAKLMLIGDFDGKKINRPLDIEVKNPFTIVVPEITRRKDTTFHFAYKIETVSATVSSVIVETKVNSAGNYSARAGTWKNNDSVSFKGSDFALWDTIYIKLTASTGAKTDSVISKLVVAPNSYKRVSTFKFDTTANQAYDFIMAREVKATAGDSADIELTSNQIVGSFDLGFVSNNNAEFVTVSEVVYGDGDAETAVSTDFGTAVQAVPDLKGGETYVFRTRRGTGPYHYGYMKVVMVDKPQAEYNDSYVKFEIKN